MSGWGSFSSSLGGFSSRGRGGARRGPGTTPTSLAIGRPTSFATASVAGGGARAFGVDAHPHALR
eukprot:7305117-Pyramimonas_sp.AAC.1